MAYLLTTSELYIQKIEGFTRSIKLGSKTPTEVAPQISSFFDKLKPLNDGMHEELMGKYKKVVADWHLKNNNK